MAGWWHATDNDCRARTPRGAGDLSGGSAGHRGIEGRDRETAVVEDSTELDLLVKGPSASEEACSSPGFADGDDVFAVALRIGWCGLRRLLDLLELGLLLGFAHE